MPNLKKVVLFGVALIGIGVVGSLVTYPISAKSISKEETFAAKDIKQLEIKSGNAKVALLPTKGQDIKVVAEGNFDQLLTDVTGNTLSVHMKERRFGVNFFGKQTTLTIHVPKQDYEAFHVKNSNGSVIIKDLEVNHIQVEVDNGKVMLEQVTAENIHGETDNGNIQLEEVEAKTIAVETDNGRISLSEVEGELIGEANNGSITLNTKHLDRSIQFKTNNGRITIHSEEKPTNAVLDLKTKNGKIIVFDESDWDTVIGQGDHLVKLSTKNGRITISH